MSIKTKNSMKFWLCISAVFLAGLTASANLSRLVATNPDYEASWGKVGFAAFIAILMGSLAQSTSK